jgi:hypothetical protein
MRKATGSILAVTVLVLGIAVPAAGVPVKTKVTIDEITHTVQPGDDEYRAKGRVKADDDGCLSKREVVIIQRLGPPFDSNSVMQTVETNKKGRWKAAWTTRSGPNDIEESSTGVHYAEVEKLKKGKRKCSFARSKEYVVP